MTSPNSSIYKRWRMLYTVVSDVVGRWRQWRERSTVAVRYEPAAVRTLTDITCRPVDDGVYNNSKRPDTVIPWQRSKSLTDSYIISAPKSRKTTVVDLWKKIVGFPSYPLPFPLSSRGVRGINLEKSWVSTLLCVSFRVFLKQEMWFLVKWFVVKKN